VRAENYPLQGADKFEGVVVSIDPKFKADEVGLGIGYSVQRLSSNGTRTTFWL
jgi:hypothetical protein